MRKRTNKIVSLMLVATLTASVFSGCGGKVTKKTAKLSNGSPDRESVVITVGSNGIKYSEAMNYSYILKKQYDGNFSSKLWEYPLEKDVTIGDEAKKEIINMMIQMEVVCQRAKKKNVELDNDEKDEAINKAESIMENVSQKDKENYYLNVQALSELYEKNILANKMFYIATDAANTNVTDEEAKQIKIQYIKITTNGTLPSGKKVILTTSEKANALLRMENVRNEAESAGDLTELAKKNSDCTESEINIGRDTDKLESKVVDAAFALKKGELSQVIDGDEGYYLVYCVSDYDEDATYQRKEEIILERQTEMFRKKYTNWLGEDEVSISKNFWQEFKIK